MASQGAFQQLHECGEEVQTMCRLCCNTSIVTNKHYKVLFNQKAINERLAERISRVIDLPVAHGDGLSEVVCLSCVRKVKSLEIFRAEARQSYLKQGYKQSTSQVSQSPPHPLICSSDASQSTRKRSKDTSGSGASPFTIQSRPSAKKSTFHKAGRRLSFTSSQCDNDTENCISVVPNELDRTIQPLVSQKHSTQHSITELEACRSATDDQTQIPPTSKKCVKISINSSTMVSPVNVEVNEQYHKIAQTLAGGHHSSIAKAVLAEPSIRPFIINKVVSLVNDECSRLCSTSTQPTSLFRKVEFQPSPSFSWRQCIDELQTKCPILYDLFWVIVSRSDDRNRAKRGEQHFPGMCLALAVLLKERNKHMSGIQTLLSLVLYSSRVQKKVQVYTRLNHIGVTISYPTVLALIKKISERHKAPIKKWVSEGLAFQFVGDNVDKYKGVRDVRSDHHGELIHMYSLLAVKARVPPPPPSIPFSPPKLYTLSHSHFMPTPCDITLIRKNLSVLVARILVQYIKPLQSQKPSVPAHIPHLYSKEMEKRSDIIVADVLHKCETKRSDMIDIMREMMEYIGDSEMKRLSMGDLLTKERQDGAKRHVICGNTPFRRLETLVPCVADWHCLLNFMENIWKVMFKKSSANHGTLMNLLLRIGRLKLATQPKKNLHACLDGLMAIFKGHIVADACAELGISNPNDDLPQSEGQIARVDISEVAMRVVDRLTIVPEAILGEPVQETNDGVYNYARVLCHHAALVVEFTDAWKEGDGPRIIRCWKIMMLHFFAGGSTKYSLEALRLQFDLLSLPPYLSHQLIWGRCVNTHGGPGRNLPCDLHNEHVNRNFKEIIGDMGANFTEQASTRVARSVSTLVSTADMFDEVTGIHPESTAHTTKSDNNDVLIIVKHVQQYKTLSIIDNRNHSFFPGFSVNPLKALNRLHLEEWIKCKAMSHNSLQAVYDDGTD